MAINKNVRYSYLFMLFELASNSIRTGDVFSIYVFTVTNNNTQVGLIQMAVGISMMVSAFPSGWLADKVKRQVICRLSVVFGLIGLVTFASQMYFQLPYKVLYVGSIFFGLYWGIYVPAFESLFADSVPPGQSKYFTIRYIISVMSYAFGSLLTTITFLILGNQWKLEYLKFNLYLGLALMLPGLIFLSLMSDNHTVDYSKYGSSNDNTSPQSTNGQQKTNGLIDSAVAQVSVEQPGQEQQQLQQQQQQLLLQQQQQQKQPQIGEGKKQEKHDEETVRSVRKGLYEVKLATRAMATSWYCNKFIPKIIMKIGFVPFSILISDIIMALASGMSLKFFSLFFINQVKLQPVYVFTMGVSSCLSISLLMQASEYLANSVGLGKVKVQMISRTMDVLLLMAMAWLPTDYELVKHILVGVHILRMGMGNCMMGLVKALLMQYTPKEVRARWNAFDSVRSFSWSGSAALGGILSQTIGYQNMFQVTALVKILAILPIIPLFFLLPDGDGKLYTGPSKQLLGDDPLEESLIPNDYNEEDQAPKV